MYHDALLRVDRDPPIRHTPTPHWLATVNLPGHEQQMSDTYDVIVIGAGISGASTAYYLKTLGVDRVLLIERDRPAAGGTGRSAAMVRQHYSTALMARLAKASIDMFLTMPEELGASGGFEQTGYYFLSPAESFDAFRQNVALQRTAGIDTRILDQSEISEQLPWLNTEDVAGVAYEPDGGYADPVRSTEAYVGAFERIGGTAMMRTPVRALTGSKDKVTGVLLDEGELAAGAIVNAAGPWARFLAESVGLDLPMRTVREQDTVWEARGDRPLPPCPISNAVDAIYLRPLGDRRFIVGRGFPKDYIDVDPYNYKTTADEEFVSDVLERLQRRFPPFAECRRIDSYAALYDVTPDWYPFVGPRDGLTGYYDISGGSGHGFKIAPAIGRELAQWIIDGTAAADFAGLTFDRVAAGQLYQGAYGGNRG